MHPTVGTDNDPHHRRHLGIFAEEGSRNERFHLARYLRCILCLQFTCKRFMGAKINAPGGVEIVHAVAQCFHRGMHFPGHKRKVTSEAIVDRKRGDRGFALIAVFPPPVDERL